MTTYIKMDGVQGNVTAKGYEGCFEAFDVQHGVSRQVVTQVGQPENRQSSKPSIESFKIIKKLDQTSPLLHSQAAYSQPKSTVTISVISNSDLRPEVVYTLSDVYISHYHVHTSSRDGKVSVIEHIELSPVKFETKYTPRDSQGNTKTPIAAGYDLETGQKV